MPLQEPQDDLETLLERATQIASWRPDTFPAPSVDDLQPDIARILAWSPEADRRGLTLSPDEQALVAGSAPVASRGPASWLTPRRPPPPGTGSLPITPAVAQAQSRAGGVPTGPSFNDLGSAEAMPARRLGPPVTPNTPEPGGPGGLVSTTERVTGLAPPVGSTDPRLEAEGPARLPPFATRPDLQPEYPPPVPQAVVRPAANVLAAPLTAMTPQEQAVVTASLPVTSRRGAEVNLGAPPTPPRGSYGSLRLDTADWLYDASRSFLKAATGALVTQTLQPIAGLSGMAYAKGDPELAKRLTVASEMATRTFQVPAMARDPFASGDLSVLFDPQWAGGQAGQLAGSIAAFAAVGSTGGIVAATFGESLLEAANVYHDLIWSGADPRTAGNQAIGTFAANAALLGLTNHPLFEAAGSFVRKAVTRAVSEGAQEGAQQVVQNVAEGRPVGDSVALSAALGSVGGIGAGSALDLLSTGRLSDDVAPVAPNLTARMVTPETFDPAAGMPLRPQSALTPAEAQAPRAAQVATPAVVADLAAVLADADRVMNTKVEPDTVTPSPEFVPVGGEATYNGPDRRQAPRTSAEDAAYQAMREAQARGEATVSPEAQAALEQQQHVDAARAPAPRAPSTTPTPIEQVPESGPVAGVRYEMPARDIGVDAKSLQWRKGANERGVTAERRIEAPYDPVEGGNLVVWQNPETGDTQVVEGHHRLDAAQRDNAKVGVIYIDAPNAEEARAFGSLMNLKQDHASLTDAVQVMLDRGWTADQLRKSGAIGKGTKIAEQARAIANLNENLRGRWQNGELSDEVAAALGRAELSPELQQQVMTRVERRGSEPNAAEVARWAAHAKAQAEAGPAPTQGGMEDLFGATADTAAFDARIKLEVALLNDLKRDSIFKGAARNADRLAKGGTTVDAAQAVRIADASARDAAVLDKSMANKGPISDALNRAAGDIAAGGNREAIYERLYAEVRQHAAAELAGGPEAVVAGSGRPGDRATGEGRGRGSGVARPATTQAKAVAPPAESSSPADDTAPLGDLAVGRTAVYTAYRFKGRKSEAVTTRVRVVGPDPKSANRREVEILDGPKAGQRAFYNVQAPVRPDPMGSASAGPRVPVTPRATSDAPRVAAKPSVPVTPKVSGVDDTTQAKASSEPKPYSRQSLQQAYRLTNEQAAAVDTLVQAIGLDTDRIQVAEGGVPSTDALTQDGDLAALAARIFATPIHDVTTQPWMTGAAGDVKAAALARQAPASHSIVNRETNHAITISRRGVQNALDHGIGPQKVAVLSALDGLLVDATFVVRDTENMRQGVTAVETYAARVRVDGTPFIARLVVREVQDGRRFYDHELSALEHARPANAGAKVRDFAPAQAPYDATGLGQSMVEAALAVKRGDPSRLFQADDVLSTGERQPRLPVVGTVREEEKSPLPVTALPEPEFRLTPKESKAKRPIQDVLFQQAATPGPFYSRIVRTLEQSPQARATGAQWVATIRNSKLGVNQDEFALTRVEDLESTKTYTKAEVLDYLRANEVVAKDVTLGDPLGSRGVEFADYQEPGADPNSYREVFLTAPAPNRGSDPLRRQGWNDGHDAYSSIANPIVRLRFNTRTTEGKTVLFLEEVQPPARAQFSKMPALFQKHWREVAFKWALHHAAERGYDGVAWTTGAQQAARYSLEHRVAHVWAQPSTTQRGAFDLTIVGHAGTGTIYDTARTGPVGTEKIGQLIGKELASKIVAQTGAHTYSGLDLKVGGEGLRKLYDVDFRHVVNSLSAVKKHGGAVGSVDMTFPQQGFRNRVYRGPVPSLETLAATTYASEIDTRRAKQVALVMRAGVSFHEAIQLHGTPDMARRLGGALEAESSQSTQPFLALTPALRSALMQGQALYQGAKGATEFVADGKAILRAFESADVSTAVHEIAHVARRQLLNREVPAAQRRGISDADIAAAEQWAGAERGVWPVAAEEKFARGFERYLRDGVSPTARLSQVFAALKSWLTDIYRTLTGSEIDVTLSPEMRKVFDALVSRLPVTPKSVDEDGPQAMPMGGPARTGSRPSLVQRSPVGALPVRSVSQTGRPVVTPRALRPAEIIRALADILKVPVAKGGFRARALAIFESRRKVIRTKLLNDLPILAHEFGHALDRSHVLGLDIHDPQWQVELTSLGATTSRPSYTGAEVRREGAAEFFRLWLTDPTGVQSLAPVFSAAFEAALDAHPEDYGRPLRRVQTSMQAFLGLDAPTRMALRIDFDGKSAGAPTAMQDPAGFISRMATRWTDDLWALEKTVQALAGGAPIDPTRNAYILARVARGASTTAHAFVTDGVRDVDGTFIGGGSLAAAIKPVHDELETFATYLVALRAPGLHTRGIDTGFSDQEARQTIQAVEARSDAQRFLEARDRIYAFQDAMLEYARRAGVLTQDSITNMKQRDSFYVPFQRVVDESAERGGSARRIANRSVPIMKIKGSGREIINPLESIIKNTYAMVDMVEKNRAMQALVAQSQEAERSGRGNQLVVPYAPKLKPTTINLDEMLEVYFGPTNPTLADLRASGITGDEDVTLWSVIKKGAKGERVVAVVIDGVPQLFQLTDPALYEAVTMISPPSPEYLKVAQMTAAILRAGATLAPGFIIRNPIRDTLTAWVQSRHGFIPVYDTARGMAKYLLHEAGLRTDRDVQLFEASGVGQAALSGVDRKQLRQHLRQLASPHAFFRSVVTNPLELMAAMSQATEAGTRLGEFTNALNMGGREGGAFARLTAGQRPVVTADSLLIATLAGRDVSTDFSRAGIWSREINRYSAFFNARVHGYVRMAESAKRDPLGVALKLGTLGLVSILLRALHDDDDEFQQIESWEKLSYWHMRVGDKFIRVPKPFEYAIVPNLIEAAWAHAKATDPDAFRVMRAQWQDFARQNTFGVIPTLLLPLLESLMNYSTFRQTNITPPWETDRPTEEQFNDFTTETAKVISRGWVDLMGNNSALSPAQIDNILFGYTAGVGRGVVESIDKGLAGLGVSARARPLPEKSTQQSPVVGAVVRDAAPGAQAPSLVRFYDAWNTYQGVSAVLREAERSHDAARAARVNAKVRALPWMKPRDPSDDPVARLKASHEALGDIRKDYRAVMDADNMTPHQKRLAIAEIRRRMVQIAQIGLGEKPMGRPPVTPKAAVAQ